ncbi:MAG: hypothetical protein KatS3mg015_1767 [Fimbriimonadales bacterium]|nr:MAG: hypothetical protein KatS3mg015_1767 [Fimbriimonadales bacterium]
MKIALVGFGLLLGWGAGAQLRDAQFIELADRYANLLGVDLDEEGASVLRDNSSVSVLDGRLFVHLDFDGKLLSFVDTKIRDPNPGAERYPRDEDAWAAVEALAARVDAPRGLIRKRIEREDTSPKGAILRCVLGERPYGFEVDLGNFVIAVLRRSDGAVLEFWVGRGAVYDPPDIRISERQAREIACEGYGGSPASWRVSLKYWRARGLPEKRYRLFYAMSRGQPGGSVMVIVDAKTGEVVEHGRFGDIPEPPPGYEPGTVVEGWEPNPGPGPSEGFGRRIPPVVYMVCAVFFGSSLFLLWRFMRR